MKIRALVLASASLLLIGLSALLPFGYVSGQSSHGNRSTATGSGTVSANSGSANAIATYAAAGGSTTVAPAANTACIPGATSGAACLSAPAVSGTATNAITSTNAVQIPAGTQYQISTDSGISRDNAKIFDFGSATAADATGTLLAAGHGSKLVSTAAITGPVPVKADTANAAQVVVTATTDTAAGIVIGVCANSPGAGGNCYVLTSGGIALTVGTGTCAIGNFVIVDTTTNGRVKCTATYAAGTVIGVALTAQGSVGSAVTTAIGVR